jgi:3-methylcrotonyl-CoA carboxylase alpha subunit
VKLVAKGTGAESELDAPAALPARVTAVRAGNVVWVFEGGETYRIERSTARPARGGHEPEEDLFAPMPGKVLKVLSSEGAVVEKGAPLLVLEAMKMEHEIRAPRAGTVKKLPFKSGDMVGLGELLVELA